MSTKFNVKDQAGNLRLKSLELTNANLCGSYQGRKFEQVGFLNDPILSRGLHLTDSLAHHVAAVYSRRLKAKMKAKEIPMNEPEVSTMSRILRNSMSVHSKALSDLFFNGWSVKNFTTKTNPWLVSGMRTGDVINFALPEALNNIASVWVRSPDTIEHKALTDLLEFLTSVGTDLVRRHDRSMQAPEGFNISVLEDRVKEVSKAKNDTRNFRMPLKIDRLPKATGRLLERCLPDMTKIDFEDRDAIVIEPGRIANFGGNLFYVKKQLQIIDGYVISDEEVVRIH